MSLFIFIAFTNKISTEVRISSKKIENYGSMLACPLIEKVCLVTFGDFFFFLQIFHLILSLGTNNV